MSSVRIAYISRVTKLTTAQIAAQYVAQNPSAATSAAEIKKGVANLIFSGAFIEARR